MSAGQAGLSSPAGSQGLVGGIGANAGTTAAPIAGVSLPNAGVSTLAGQEPVIPKGDPEVCASVTVTATRVIPNITLVLDGSSSMNDRYGTAGSRWDALQSVLATPDTGILARLQDRIHFGVAVFAREHSFGRPCPLHGSLIAPTLNNYQPIADELARNWPGSGTPTGEALEEVTATLPDNANSLDANPEPHYILLGTDGQPNSCGGGGLAGGNMQYARSEAAVQAANAKGITVYVLSLAPDEGSDYAAHLQRMANLGQGMAAQQTPGAEVYTPTDPAQLQADLEALIGELVGCDVVLDGKVSGDACEGTVTLNGTEITCGGTDGWELAEPSIIRLNGTSCEKFKNAAQAMLTQASPAPCKWISTPRPSPRPTLGGLPLLRQPANKRASRSRSEHSSPQVAVHRMDPWPWALLTEARQRATLPRHELADR